jgi:hypothetical protein
MGAEPQSDDEMNQTGPTTPAHDSAVGETVDRPPTPVSKTPLFQAINAARYQRQALIREIQGLEGPKLICYVAGIDAPVDREDVLGIVDLLHNIPPGHAIDLMLHTGGGDIDAAEKLMGMVRKCAGTSEVRVIVPDFAKSAGTLMALGADRILMSDSSELGKIDPQVIRTDGNGNAMWHSVQNYLDAYKDLCQRLARNPDDVAAQTMLNKLDPETVQLFQSIMTRARQFAEKQLKQGMMRNVGNWSLTASALLDSTVFPTHGQPISWEEANDNRVGLAVDYKAPGDPMWQLIWQLYSLQVLAVRDHQKLFESDVASLCIDSRVI